MAYSVGSEKILYSLIHDHNKYLKLLWDREQISSLVDEMGCAMQKRIDMWNAPCSFRGVINETLRVSFPVLSKDDKNCAVPDIAIDQGRIFLNKKAYTVLKSLIENDGEFLPVTYEEGDGYIFIPLKVAESVEGLDTKLSLKNEWGDVENIAFIEEKVKDWSVFRCEFNSYMSAFCSEEVKQAIERNVLTGLYITPDLGNIFPEGRGDVSSLDG